jgi:hypothetical protein
VIDDPNIELPKEVETYLVALEIENKPLTRATVVNLRIIISCYLRSDNGPPSLVSERLPNTAMMVKMICAFHSMAAAIMSPQSSPDHADGTERLIKIFLSIYSRIEEAIRVADGNATAKQKPDWVTHYNFTSLLNLPAVMREFGPLRNLWEGGECGEKFIRRSKDALSNGLRGNWEVVTARKILTDQSIRNMCQRYESVSTVTAVKRILEAIRKEAKIYKSTSEVLESFKKAVPLSVIVDQTCIDPCLKVFAVAYDEKSDMTVTVVELKQIAFDASDGCHHYFKWSASLEGDHSNEQVFENFFGGMLLPNMIDGSNENAEFSDEAQPIGQANQASERSYTLLVSDWRELDEEGSIRAIGSLPFSSFP